MLYTLIYQTTTTSRECEDDKAFVNWLLESRMLTIQTNLTGMSEEESLESMSEQPQS